MRRQTGKGALSAKIILVKFCSVQQTQAVQMLGSIEAKRLDNGSSISKTLLENKAKWHKSCNLKFNSTKLKRAEKKRRSNDAAEEPSTKKYIEDLKDNDNVAPVFKLADLVKLYGNRLTLLGMEFNQGVHSTRLKNAILSNFRDMSAYRGGRDVVLAFNKGIGSAVLKASIIDHDEDVIILSKAAKIVR
eukprot:gene1834-2058_t